MTNLPLIEAIKNRRTHYRLSKEKIVSSKRVKEIIEEIILHTPSAFNAQSTRMVLLLDKQHDKLWNEIVLDALHKETNEEGFARSKAKVEGAFASGYGTVLFFEDQNIVEDLKEKYPLYKNMFDAFSHHTNAMHQFALWTSFEAEGLGASLQHYNPIIDDAVYQAWNLPTTWKLIAQMPFGKPLDTPGEKAFDPIDKRFLSFE